MRYKEREREREPLSYCKSFFISNLKPRKHTNLSVNITIIIIIIIIIINEPTTAIQSQFKAFQKKQKQKTIPFKRGCLIPSLQVSMPNAVKQQCKQHYKQQQINRITDPTGILCVTVCSECMCVCICIKTDERPNHIK